MQSKPARKHVFREGTRVLFRDKPSCQAEREVRNLFIPITISGPRFSRLKRGDDIWTREQQGFSSEFTKHTLSHVAVRNDEIRLYWSDNNYLLSLDPQELTSRVFLVDDEDALVWFLKQHPKLFRVS